jgi:hypothetical protein
MGPFYFEREVRTPYSEVYTILEDEAVIGRIDLHYVSGMVHGTLSIGESVTQEGIQDLIDALDEEIVDSVGISREEFIIHVHQGRDIGVWSKNDFTENGNGHGEHGNGEL